MSKKYINADLIIEKLENQRYILFQNYLHDRNKNCTSDHEYAEKIASVNHVKSVLQNAPAADVRENEYSHKVWCPNGSKECQCAECGAFVDWEDKYCHECGKVLLSEG